MKVSEKTMTNNVKSQSKNKWTNSDLSSLTLWVNEGVPLDEIAKRLKKSTASIANVLSNKSSQFRPALNNKFLKKSEDSLVHHKTQYIENIIFITSINKLNENFYSARAFLCDTKLSESMGILNSEFTSIEACFRWFSELPNNFFTKLN
jgi:hypothetical protein